MTERVWSIFNQDDRLVLALSDEPGEVNFTRLPEDGTLPVRCAFATLQCYDSKTEPEILNNLMRAADLEDFLARLKKGGFKIRTGRPKPYKFARL